MNKTTYGLQLAAAEVMQEHEIPSPADLVMQLSEIEGRKKHLMKMLDWCSATISQPVNEGQYQMLMDFLLLQAAKKNINSEDLMAEIQFKYMLTDLRELPVYSLWDAMTFIKSFS